MSRQNGTSPRTASARLPLVALAAAVVVAGACSLGSGGGAATPAPTSTAAPTSASPTGPALPAGWTLCVNAARGTSMGYPATWHQPDPPLPGAQPCSSFQPFAFAIPAASDYHLIALNASQQTDSVATYIANSTDATFYSVLVNEAAAAVDGHPSRRFEVSSTGDGLDEAGTRTYGYAIDRDGHAFVVWTIARPGEAAYPSWKGVVDQAVATLDFTP